MFTTDDAAQQQRATAEAQIAEALRDLQARLNPAPAAGAAGGVPAAPAEAAALFASADDAGNTAASLADEAERLSGLLARTRAAVSRLDGELATIAEQRAERAATLAAAEAEQRELGAAVTRAEDDKAALARIGGDLARADAQLHSLVAQHTAARERHATLAQSAQAADAAAARREMTLLRERQQHAEAYAGYERDLQATQRQAHEATQQQRQALLAGYRAQIAESAERASRLQMEALAARGQADYVRREARQQLAAWAKTDRAIGAFVAELAHTDAPPDPLDALLAAHDQWLAALQQASGRVPTYRELLDALAPSISTLAALLRSEAEAASIVPSRREAVRIIRARVAAARGENNR